MRKQLFIFILVFTPLISFAVPAKQLAIQTGSQWLLANDLTLKKNGLSRDEFVPYTRVWDLRSKSFISSSSSSSDSCEFRTTISKKLLKAPQFTIKKAAHFKVGNIQETTMSILIDILSKNAKKSGIDQIQITCSAYSFNLDTPELKEKFKTQIGQSLSHLFASKN